jgi:signal transduction histidine kinase
VFSLRKRPLRIQADDAPRTHLEERRQDRKCAEVLAQVAHEVRQPLAAAWAALHVLQKSQDEGQRKHAHIVLDKQFVRMTRLVDDVLDASRLHLGKTILRLERLDLRFLVEEVAESLRSQVGEKQQQLDMHVPPDPVLVDADSSRLQQVVSNLLVNGVKYTGSGGRLWIDVTRERGDAVVTVGDTGCGIAPELLQRIFDPFIKGDVTSQEGLGVGLAIAQQLVALHSGTIRASSPGPGMGSEFVVTLPTQAG